MDDEIFNKGKGRVIMPIAKDKDRIVIIVPKELKSEVERIAQEQDRSMSNLIAIILKDYVKQKKTQNEVLQAEKNSK